MSLKLVIGVTYITYRIPGETGSHARLDSFLVESGPDSDGLHTIMRASGPLHGQRFRADSSRFDRLAQVYSSMLSTRELIKLTNCAPELAKGDGEDFASDDEIETYSQAVSATARTMADLVYEVTGEDVNAMDVTDYRQARTETTRRTTPAEREAYFATGALPKCCTEPTYTTDDANYFAGLYRD